MKKQNNNQHGSVEKMVVLVKTFDHYHRKFQLFKLSCKTVNGFEFRLKFNHDFTNNCYLHSGLKSFTHFQDKKSPEGKT